MGGDEYQLIQLPSVSGRKAVEIVDNFREETNLRPLVPNNRNKEPARRPSSARIAQKQMSVIVPIPHRMCTPCG